MQYVQNISLSVLPTRKYLVIHAKQSDNASRYLRITLRGGSEQLTPESGVSAVFRCLKPDGTSCINSGTVNSDGTVTVELTDQALACKGITKADVSLVNGDSVLSTATFLIQVDETPTSDDNTPSTNEFLLLSEKVTEATNAASAANTAAANANTAADNANRATASANDAEAARAKAEAARVAAENSRVTAESLRVSAENARASAESDRITAENARVEAEKARQAASAEAVENCEAATNTLLEQVNRIAFSLNAEDGGLDIIIYEEDT